MNFFVAKPFIRTSATMKLHHVLVGFFLFIVAVVRGEGGDGDGGSPGILKPCESELEEGDLSDLPPPPADPLPLVPCPWLTKEELDRIEKKYISYYTLSENSHEICEWRPYANVQRRIVKSVPGTQSKQPRLDFFSKPDVISVCMER